MNISFNWLKDLIEIDLTAEETAAALTRVGLAVEGIHPHGDDLILDIDLTSNRPDCLSHLGIARELCVITGKPLNVGPGSDDIPVPAALAGDVVTIEDPDLCNRFTARIIRDVKVGPSPKWLVDRLEALGERSINNVVDITNYVMLELGQPMHAFDLDKLAGQRIVVRRAKEGEKILTLKEEEKALDSAVLAICDAEKPAAIGGIIGGMHSSITDETVNVLLEVAYFNRSNIRASSRALNIATEASYRFERGVDIQNLLRASHRATELICELASGTKGDLYDVYPQPQQQTRIVSPDPAAQVRRLTGLTIEPAECERLLSALGLRQDHESELPSYISPSWRYDVAIEEDLVEEIARHLGYENIGTELPPAYGAGEYQPSEMRKRRTRSAVTAAGFDEAITYSFIDVSNDGLFDTVPELVAQKLDEKFIELEDAVIEGAVRMRPTLLPGLLDAVRLNLNHQRRDVRLFEIGRAFAAADTEDKLPKERELLALVMTGNVGESGPALKIDEVDFYDAKGAVETLLFAAGSPAIDFAAGDVKHLRKGQAAAISIAGRVIGSVGRLSDDIAADYKFKQAVYVAELDLDAVLEAADAPAAYIPLGRYPAVTRDVSLVGDRSVSWSDIRETVLQQNFELCRGVDFVDVYQGKGMDEGQRSITVRLTYRSDDRTLVEADVEQIHSSILHHLDQQLGLKPRF